MLLKCLSNDKGSNKHEGKTIWTLNKMHPRLLLLLNNKDGTWMLANSTLFIYVKSPLCIFLWLFWVLSRQIINAIVYAIVLNTLEIAHLLFFLAWEEGKALILCSKDQGALRHMTNCDKCNWGMVRIVMINSSDRPHISKLFILLSKLKFTTWFVTPI